MKSLLSMIVLIAISASVGAHVDHEHMEFRFDLPTWESRLRAFQETGSGIDLSIAEQISQRLLIESPTAPEYLYLAAQTAQAGHRFSTAQSLLQQLLRARSGMDQARLMLSNVWLVQGNRRRAEAECKKLRRTNVVVILTCRAQAMSVVTWSDHDKLMAVLQKTEQQLPVQIEAWVHAVLGDLAIRMGSSQIATRHYEDAFAKSPLIRYRSALVDLYLSQDSFVKARHYIDIGQESVGMQVKSFVLSSKLGRLDDSDPALRHLDEIFTADMRDGDYTHGREMAEFYLFVKKDRALAQSILQHAFRIQQEPEDLRLLALVNSSVDV